MVLKLYGSLIAFVRKFKILRQFIIKLKQFVINLYHFINIRNKIEKLYGSF